MNYDIPISNRTSPSSTPGISVCLGAVTGLKNTGFRLVKTFFFNWKILWVFWLQLFLLLVWNKCGKVLNYFFFFFCTLCASLCTWGRSFNTGWLDSQSLRALPLASVWLCMPSGTFPQSLKEVLSLSFSLFLTQNKIMWGMKVLYLLHLEHKLCFWLGSASLHLQ